MAASGSGRLMIVKRDGTEGSGYQLNIGSLTLGSSKDCDIILTSKGVPPKQCVITVHPNEARIKNLSQDTSTVVNSESVTSKVLRHCDLIVLGNAKFRWEYANKTVETVASSKKAIKKTTTVKRTRNSVTRRKSESNLRKSTNPLETKGRSSLNLLSKPQSRQIAIVKPQTRHMPTPSAAIQLKNKMESKGPDTETKTLLSSGKKKKVEKVEKFDSPVILDKNKRAALLLLTKRSPQVTSLHNSLLKNTPKPKLACGSVQSPLSISVTRNVKELPKISNLSKTPNVKVSNLVRKSIINQSKKRLSVPSKPKMALHTPDLKNKFNTELKRKLINAGINSHHKKRDTLRSSASTPNNNKQLKMTPTVKLDRTRRSLTLKTPTPSPKNISNSKNTSSVGNPSNTDTVAQNNNASPFISFLSSLTNALNIMNNSEIDLEAVRKTPEFRAISNKIKSVEKLEKSTFVKSPSPHILEIGRISRSGKKIFLNTNNTQNHVTPSNVASNSPIISPKHTSPELFDSTANYIDINTPNLSQIFDFKSSTPMVVLKNTPVIHPRRSRKSLYHSNNKNSEISKAKSKTEPRKRFKVKISFNSSNRKMDFDEECSPDETRVSNTNEMQLTPKSSLKPPPEVLKEKHSTAKKPVSKRSLIDHLIRSPEVAKELFKSPVKRILSQSMRHYDSILDGDNEDISIANSFNRDSSFELLTRSKRQSNNLNSETLKKNQKLKKSPRNNLSDFQGVRRLLRTPAKNKNDLTDVKGVKQLFKNNSPRNNLSNIGNIKKLFDKTHNSPKNNLMNITGVKNIFKETKPQNSPRNDLTNVVGVKELFKVTRAQKSPRNDLTNITGVKNIFKITKKQNSPRNDLTNIDGLKQLFRVTRNHKSPVNDLTNISGVKDIFEQNQIQNLFDVSETQKLSRIPKNQKSPRNDLTNITGVKNFFKTRNSPKNNLTNISNVGEIFEEIKTRNSFERNSTNACGMKKSLNPSLKKSPSNSLLNVSGLENSFKSPLRSKRGSVDNLVGYVSPVVANQQSDLIRKKIALEKENSKLNRSSVNLYDPRDSICPSSSVLENVGLVPSSLFKLKSENNNSTNRSRRQATIDKTSFSLELSKVNMSAKKDSKPAKTDTGVISCHSTPFVKTKMDISDLRQVSPILPDIQNCEKSPVSRTTRKRPKTEKNNAKVTVKKTKVKQESNIKVENPDSENVEVKIERRTRSAVNNIRKVEIMEKPNASESPVKIEPTATSKSKCVKKKVTFDLANDEEIDKDSPKAKKVTRPSKSSIAGVLKKDAALVSKKTVRKSATSSKTTAESTSKKKSAVPKSKSTKTAAESVSKKKTTNQKSKPAKVSSETETKKKATKTKPKPDGEKNVATKNKKAPASNSKTTAKSKVKASPAKSKSPVTKKVKTSKISSKVSKSPIKKSPIKKNTRSTSRKKT